MYKYRVSSSANPICVSKIEIKHTTKISCNFQFTISGRVPSAECSLIPHEYQIRRCLTRLKNTNPNLKMSVKLEVANSEQFTKCEMYILGTFLRQKSLSKNLRFSDQCQNRIQTSTFQITVFENHSKMSHLTNIFFKNMKKLNETFLIIFVFF